MNSFAGMSDTTLQIGIVGMETGVNTFGVKPR